MAWWAITSARNTATWRETPLTIRVEDSRLREAHSANQELEDEFWHYCHTDENSDRVGEFAIGTNIGVHDVIGNILQDEKIPGIHIAFGNPYGAHTGADWYSVHAHRRGRPQVRYLDRRPADHARRSVPALIPSLRQQFNQRLDARELRRFLELIEQRCGVRHAVPPQRNALLSSRAADREDGALRPRDGGATAGRSASTRRESRAAIPAALSRAERSARAALRAGRFRPGCRSRAASWSRSRAFPRSTPISR